MYHSLPVRMRIGYRSDEKERMDTFKETLLYSTHCEMHIDQDGKFEQRVQGSVTYPVHRNGFSFAHRWQEIPFRIGEFPLIDDNITQFDVIRYWRDKDIVFPEDSNCKFCFWKNPAQLRENFDTAPNIMKYGIVMEVMMDNQLHDDYSLLQISRLGLQQDLFPSASKGGGCHGGYCIS